MDWIRLPLGLLQTNAYVVYNKKGRCLIVDPGGEEKKIHQFVQKKKLKPQAILLTHAHFDHIGAVDVLREKYNIPAYVHQKEKKWLSNPLLNGSEQYEGVASVAVKGADHLFSKEEELAIGGFTFQLFETPGHSPGSVSFYFKESGLVIVGDTLFEGGIGRTDLKGGQESQLLKSIRQKLFLLPEGTYVLPGHDQVTTIGQEIKHNPFFNKKRG
ncbi:MBL fold metallo-hydrolase [Domibacillus sp. A3M-37]|uniref:MBL fold metallo-hydrolase n=1 Tax=Domibacillus TaxID=1433999 RepID=UPI000617E7DD|nr:MULTISPECIES: MBL fold metallo-hydrolase [Domibacillus]MCP3764161.1 MBL fold metallo-hydrolase [Domibacillus sp. A3M-37]